MIQANKCKMKQYKIKQNNINNIMSQQNIISYIDIK